MEDPREIVITKVVLWCGSDRCKKEHQNIESAWKCAKRKPEAKQNGYSENEWLVRYTTVMTLRKQGLSLKAIGARFDRSYTWARGVTRKACRLYESGRRRTGPRSMRVYEEMCAVGITNEDVERLF